MPNPSEPVDMRYTDFSKLVALPGATFKTISFRGAQFGERAYFHAANFEDGASFNRVHFGENTDFSGARFGGRAYFSFARFGEHTQFSEAHFDKSVFFNGARFGGLSFFNDAVFEKAESRNDVVSFENAVFEGPTSFERTTFTSLLPLLKGAVLHETTTVTADDKYWPPIKRRPKKLIGRWQSKIPDSASQPTQASEEVKASAAKLRHAMARQMLPEEEHFFYRREMYHAARIGPWLPRLPILIFEGLSNFGYSIARPLLLLVFLWVIFGLGYLQSGAFADPTHVAGEEMVRALGFSFGTAFGFFGFQRAYFGFEFLRALPDWMQAMAATQTVLSFILLFFLGLGLRTRFRLR